MKTEDVYNFGSLDWEVETPNGYVTMEYPNKRSATIDFVLPSFNGSLSFDVRDCHLEGQGGMYRQTNDDCGNVYVAACPNMKPKPVRGCRPKRNRVQIDDSLGWDVDELNFAGGTAFMERQLSSSKLNHTEANS